MHDIRVEGKWSRGRVDGCWDGLFRVEGEGVF